MKNTYVVTGAGQGSGRFFSKTIVQLGFKEMNLNARRGVSVY